MSLTQASGTAMRNFATDNIICRVGIRKRLLSDSGGRDNAKDRWLSYQRKLEKLTIQR